MPLWKNNMQLKSRVLSPFSETATVANSVMQTWEPPGYYIYVALPRIFNMQIAGEKRLHA